MLRGSIYMYTVFIRLSQNCKVRAFILAEICDAELNPTSTRVIKLSPLYSTLCLVLFIVYLF